MLQLSLSWLGMGPLTASPWHLLLLGGASWILARILPRIYAYYDNCNRLRCFPQPPKPSWFWGHLALVSVAVGGSLGRCVPNVFAKVLVELGSGEAWNTGQKKSEGSRGEPFSQPQHSLLFCLPLQDRGLSLFLPSLLPACFRSHYDQDSWSEVSSPHL